MTDEKNSTNSKVHAPAQLRFGRRRLLGVGAAAAAAATFPHIWVPKAIASSGARGAVKHLIYIRLGGGFRFPCGFNADVGGQFNPFGVAQGVPSGVSWGVSSLLESAPFLTEPGVSESGMAAVSTMANKITVMPTVDHEPLAGRADGNHDTGLERYLTGSVNGDAGIFTRIQKGLKARYQAALAEEKLLLPPFVMGSAGMARGLGDYAPHRPPVLSGASFERFAAGDGAPPDWLKGMVRETDARMRDRQHPALRAMVDAYIQTRAATEAYSEIFASDALKVNNGSEEIVDGVSNQELEMMFGSSGESNDIRLALRLFHYGCPAVYLDQGGYDNHSNEYENLPVEMERLNRLLSGLMAVLPRMVHPDGGSYWDHTVVAIGSEFSRTAGGGRFNSAQGSDHSGDNSTRWMSMPFMGGPIQGGRVVGATTRQSDLAAEGQVYSYRSVVNTLMDGLGCDESVFFPADDCVPNLLAEV